MSRERSCNGTCYTCKEPLLGQKCICKSCLENPIQGLGDLYAKRRGLITRRNELQESLQLLMKAQVGPKFCIVLFELSWQDLVTTGDASFVGINTSLQEIEETQQIELRIWRDKAQKARIARERAQLQTLSTTRQATESNASAKAVLASSIDQVLLENL